MMADPFTPTRSPLDVIWHSPRLSSMEHFRYREQNDVHLLGGTVVLPRKGRPTTISYEVVANGAWELVRAHVVVSGSGDDTQLAIRAERGTWFVDNAERPDLAGCTDIDLGWTPSTNTLPMRRTQLDIGESTTIQAAWVTFPELEVHSADQHYIRNDESQWTYTSGTFVADLTTNELAIVVHYGPDLWITVASSRSSS